MTECASGFQFACSFVKELLKQTAGRLVSVADLLVLVSWSPFWSVPKQEPAYPLADLLCYLRVLAVNVAVAFRNSAGIWPDVLLVMTHLLSAVVLSDTFLDSDLYLITLFVTALEFVLVFFSGERRRQRKLWTHNATFRISQLTRNPFQRSTRRSLLLPLLNRRPNSHDESDDVNVVKLHGEIASSFVDITPEVSGHHAEKRILHVHCLTSGNSRARATVVFLHQFGSGAFTWQPVLADLTNERLNVIAFDRAAHGLTFASEPLLESREASVHTTPLGDEEIPTVHFSDAVNTHRFEVELVDALISNFVTGGEDRPIFLVAAGGAGAKIALDYTINSVRKSKVRGLVFVSPFDMSTDGVPSVLKSVVAAQVGRALVVSMAKSEVTDVLVRRSWESKPIPSSITEAYKKSVETPGWEDAMLNLLKRPSDPQQIPPLSVPVLVIAGACDHFIESIDEYRDFAARFPNSAFEVIPKVGASPQEEKPKDVSRLIRAFIARTVG